MEQRSTIDTGALSFRLARLDEAAMIAKLINSAYRGESSRAGWSSEAHLLEGQRTDENEIRRLITTADSIILLCLEGDEVVGSINIQNHGAAAYLGMIVARPDLQGRGIGKKIIAAAESVVRQDWGLAKASMTVLTLREELIEFYLRRGYRRTGQIIPFPDDPGAGIPLVDGLQLEVLEKDLPSAG